MKNLIYLILLFENIFAADLVLNRYEDDGQSIDIYHLVDNKNISCEQEYGIGFEKIIKCKLSDKLKKDISKRQDTYFDIEFNNNEVKFYAKSYVKLLPIDQKLINKELIKKPLYYKHWVIIGAKKEPKILHEKSIKEFNFPITLSKHKTPYISALDLNAEPIKHKKGAIVLSQIKKLYKMKKYKALISKSDEYLKKPHDSFSSDISLFKLRALVNLARLHAQDYTTVSQDASDWIAQNPSNEHIPEVYKYIIESYFARGRLVKGEKYLNILKSAFPNSKDTQQAEIKFADAIYKTKKRRKEALKIYKNVLYSTKDLDTASLSAMEIAKTYLDFKEPGKAKKIVEKVFKSNKIFIQKESTKSYDLAKRFMIYEKYDISIKILRELMKNKKDPNLQSYMKNLALSLEKSGDNDNAINLYTQYIKKYKKGKYIAFAKEHLDGLMINTNENNLTKKMFFLDKLLKKYKQTPLYKNALREKIKLLNKQKDYEKILKLKDTMLENGLGNELNQSMGMYVYDLLDKKECKKAVSLQISYKLKITKNYDEKYYHCLLKTGKYKEALKLSQKYVNSTDLNEKLKWLYLTIKVYKKLDQNKKVVLAGEEVLKLSKILHKNKYEDVLYDIATAYYNLNSYDDLMLRTVQKIEKKFPQNIKNIDLFMKIVRYGEKKKNTMLILNYAKKIIALQKKYKLHVYTPKIEIIYINALKKIGKPKAALQEAKKIRLENLNDIQKAELLYLEGDLSIVLGDKGSAKSYFLQCGEIVEDNAWQKMCAEHLKLLSE